MAPPLAARACQGDWANEAGWEIELADEETVEVVEVVVVLVLVAVKRGVSVGDGVLAMGGGGDRS